MVLPLGRRDRYDAVVIGSGPNGLAAAIALAQAGCAVLVVEGRDMIGGGLRTFPLTEPGLLHDICSTAHPLGVASPFFRALPLHEYGLEWIHAPAALAHPFDDGTAIAVYRSVTATAAQVDPIDRAAYIRLWGTLASAYPAILRQFLGPLRPPRLWDLPALAAFGAAALLPATRLARLAFRRERARALLAGHAAHSLLALDLPATSGFGLVLGMLAHAVGWPLARGGSQAIADALAAYLRTLDGEIVTGVWIESLEQLPPARAYLFDTSPRGLLQIAGHALPEDYRRALARFRYGPGSFKVDYALSGPIPWTAAACHEAHVVHVGGTLDAIAASERAAWEGRRSPQPFVLVAQSSRFDGTRAASGLHTAWAYCHVPHGSDDDHTEALEAQIERFAPGFRDRIVARATRTARQMERYNPNYVGGDLNAGVQDLRQLFTRPVARIIPYSTPLAGVFLCSSSTPPGGGVHGMAGWWAAQYALRHIRG
ncbi:MAG: phytoene desaturase family protein [Candidatus Flexifilum sp.]